MVSCQHSHPLLSFTLSCAFNLKLHCLGRDSLSPTKAPPASGQGNGGEEAGSESGSEALGFLRRISACLSSAAAGGGVGGGVGVGIEVGKPPKTLPKGKSERAKAQVRRMHVQSLCSAHKRNHLHTHTRQPKHIPFMDILVNEGVGESREGYRF
jgi:hypothetical protein